VRTLRDTWLVFRRSVGITLRNPAWVAIGLFQPLLYLFLFAPLLEPVASARGFPAGGALNVFVPGLIVQLGVFGAFFVGFSLLTELRLGVVERLQVTPVSRVALLLGRTLRDVCNLLAGSLLLVACAVPLGLRPDPAGVAVLLALQALIGLLFASLSYTLALALRSEDAFAPLLTSVSLPLLLLSGVLLPLSLAPAWLRAIAAANPLSYAVEAARAAFNDHPGDPSVARGMAIVAVLAALSLAGAARAFGRAAA
jgi:ABC-2 type transport system permease protein